MRILVLSNISYTFSRNPKLLNFRNFYCQIKEFSEDVTHILVTFHCYSSSFIRLATQSTHHSSFIGRRCCLCGRGEDELIIDVMQFVGPLVFVKSLFSFFAYPNGFFEPSSAFVWFAIYDLCLFPIDSVIGGCNMICNSRFVLFCHRGFACRPGVRH